MKKSEQTKRVFMAAFKSLLEEKSFQKINVSDISVRTGVSRKSFYYHYRDKYDLLTDIFYREFLMHHEEDHHKDWMKNLCDYFYEHRDFYSKVMEYEGQNSFFEFMGSCISARLLEHTPVTEKEKLCAAMLSDGMMAMVKRWLTQEHTLPPDEFFGALQFAARQAYTLWA